MDFERYTKDDLDELLNLNDDFVEQALLTMYHFQTPEEKDTMRGCEINHLGFNAHDSVLLVGYAEKLLTFDYITDEEFKCARKELKKYHRQLLAVLNNDIPNPLKEDIVIIDKQIKKRALVTCIMNAARKFIVKMYEYGHGNSISAYAGTTGYCAKGPSSKLFIKLSKVSNNDKIKFKITRNAIEIDASGDKQISEILEGLEFILFTLKSQIKEKQEKDDIKKC